MSYLQDDFSCLPEPQPPKLGAAAGRISDPKIVELAIEGNLPAAPQFAVVNGGGEVQLDLDHAAQAIHHLVQKALRNEAIRTRLIARFDEAQARDLYLQSLSSPERFFISASVTPIVLPDVQEVRLSEMAHAISVTKIAIVEQAANNRDLLEFLLEGIGPIGREIMQANLGRLPDHLRTRFDTYTSLADDYADPPAVLELNGGEPRSDLGSSRMNEIVVGLLFDYLCTQQSALKAAGLATPTNIEIMRCFPATLLPIERVIERICSVYSEKQQQTPNMPEHFNVGLLVFEDPVSDAPLCPISSHEARRSSAYYEAYEKIDRAVGFNPFDIVGFEAAPEGPLGAVLPLVRDEQGQIVRVDFIRRLHGEPMENLAVWEKLKSERPEIYYPFTGVPNDQFNPSDGRKHIPMWRWMNPLNSLLTCKRLDAIVTDTALQERFGVLEAVMEYLAVRRPELSVAQCVDEAHALLILSGHYTPTTRALRAIDENQGLYPGDSDPRGTLSQGEIARIKADRAGHVLKLDPWGFGGEGVIVGATFELADFPDTLVSELNQRIDRGEFDAQFSPEKLDFRDMFWPHLIDIALERGGAICQRFAAPQPYPVSRLITINGRSALELQQIWDTDVCVSCIGTEMQNILGRASQGGHANVTGNPAATRVTSIPRDVAKRVLGLVKRYHMDAVD